MTTPATDFSARWAARIRELTLAEPEPVSSAAQGQDVAPVTQRQARSRRQRDVRATTVNLSRESKRSMRVLAEEYPEQPGHDYFRPKTRGECVDGPRPCPFASCRHNLYLDVSAKGTSLKINFPDLEIWEVEESCVLDIADRGEATLKVVGAAMNITRERVRQIENVAKKHWKRADRKARVATHDLLDTTRRAAPATTVEAEDDDG